MARTENKPTVLPRLVLIADRFTEPDVASRVVAAVQGGLRWVHLRDHAAEPEAFREAVHVLAEQIRAQSEDVLLSVNTRVEVARDLAVGLHVGRRGPRLKEARAQLGKGALIGYSAHAGDASVPSGFDYGFFSPVFSTGSKPGHPGTGLSPLAAACTLFGSRPVFALGGVTPERIAACRRAGAYGAAVLSGILHAPNPAAAARTYLNALAQERSPSRWPPVRCNPKSAIQNPK